MIRGTKPIRFGLLTSTACLLCFCWMADQADGDVVVLHNGGRVAGTLLDAKKAPRDKYVLETAGGKVTFDKSQVKEIIEQSASEAQYEKARREYPDTPEGQLALAAWCRDHNLPKQRLAHLERAIELDPNFADAHRLLGHMQVDGVWKSKRQFFEDQGYVHYEGRWMTPQEMELKEAARKVELAEKEWIRKLKRWRGWLDGPQAQEAIDQINRIGDPYASRALAESLTAEKDEHYRKMYVEALARIDTPSGWIALCGRALSDPVEEVRLTCLDYLSEHPSPAYTEFFVGKLRDKENKTVNRAALALGTLKDRKAILPLIEALVTSHVHMIAPAQQGTTAGFGGMTGGGSGGFSGSFGNSGPKLIRREYKNEDVLQALTDITQQNYLYEKDAWKAWYASQRRSLSLNARRDEK